MGVWQLIRISLSRAQLIGTTISKGKMAEEPQPEQQIPKQERKSHKKDSAANSKEMLKERFKKVISPFKLSDLPLSDEEGDLFDKRYLYQGVLGAGGFGVVVAAVDRLHLEECAIKVAVLDYSVDHD